MSCETAIKGTLTRTPRILAFFLGGGLNVLPQSTHCLPWAKLPAFTAKICVAGAC